MQYFNYKTKQWDERPAETEAIMREYIPQNATAQNLFTVYLELGLPKLQAMLNVLNLSIGQEPPFKPPE